MSKCSLSLRDFTSKDGKKQIVISVSHRGKSFRVTTKQSVTDDEWKLKTGRAYSIAKTMLGKIQLMIENLSLEGKLGDVSPDELREMCDVALGLRSAPRKRLLFSSLMLSHVENKTSQRTKETYLGTLAKIRQYTGSDDILITDMNRSWLESFDAWMARGGLSVNSRGLHLRNIRAVFNEAIKNEITTFYPFRTLRIKKEETRHRALTLDQIRELKNIKLTDKMKQLYRDLFLLDFYLIGINSVDLFEAKPDQIVNGRLEYRRSKTGRLFSIKVEPEAMKIMKRWRGGKHLLCVLDRYKSLHDFNRRWRDGLKTIGTGSRRGVKGTGKPILPDGVTPYWARHSWATIAFNDAGIEKDAVSLALGHSFGVAVTDIYISYESKIVDDANRKVIDLLNT